MRYDVKRGLRDLNGKGVLAGLTEISDIIAKKMVDGQEIPCDGKLYYRGIDVEKLVAGALKEGRFGFEETAYLLLLGRLPTLLSGLPTLGGHLEDWAYRFTVALPVQFQDFFQEALSGLISQGISLPNRFYDAFFWRRPRMREALDTWNRRYDAELDRLDRLEAEGRAYVFYANDQGVKNTERDAEKLARNYERGRMQALSEFDKWERFLSGQGV